MSNNTNDRSKLANAELALPDDVDATTGEVLAVANPLGLPDSTAILGHPSMRYPARDNVAIPEMLEEVSADPSVLDALVNAGDDAFAEDVDNLIKFVKPGDEARGIFLGRSWMPTAGELDRQGRPTGKDVNGQPSGLVEAWFACKADGGTVVARKIHQTAIQGQKLDMLRVKTPCRIIFDLEEKRGTGDNTRAIRHFRIQPLKLDVVRAAREGQQQRNVARANPTPEKAPEKAPGKKK